jgi:hypothetical protein
LILERFIHGCFFYEFPDRARFKKSEKAHRASNAVILYSQREKIHESERYDSQKSWTGQDHYFAPNGTPAARKLARHGWVENLARGEEYLFHAQFSSSGCEEQISNFGFQ